MFVFALCLIGTALALPAIPPAPILPLEGDVIISSPHVLMTYGASPEFAPFRTLDFKIEPEPKDEKEEELVEKKEELELEKKEEEEPKTEIEEPKKPVKELKPETEFINLGVPKPHFFIDDWLSFLPSFSLPSSITNWFSSGNKVPSRILYPGVPGYVIVEESKP